MYSARPERVFVVQTFVRTDVRPIGRPARSALARELELPWYPAALELELRAAPNLD